MLDVIKKYFWLGLVVIGMIVLFGTINSNKYYIIVEELMVFRSPVEMYPEMNPWKNAGEKWNEEYDYHFSGQIQDDFDEKKYKNDHPEELVNVSSNSEGKSIEVFSDKMPDKKIFPKQRKGSLR